jgi:hypothetical protein
MNFSNQNIIIGANIQLNGNSTLMLTNCVLTLNQSTPNSVLVITNQYSNLILKNVVIKQTPNCLISNWVFQGNSNITMINVNRGCIWFTVNYNAKYYSTGGSTGITLLQQFTGSLSIISETNIWFELYFPNGKF